MNETCKCGKDIQYYEKFGVHAWRHTSGSEFCNRFDNDLQRADPHGEETR